MIQRIGHVAIRTRDIEKSAAFYREVLGMPEAFRMYNADGAVGSVHMFVAPSQYIELFPNGSDQCPPSATMVGHCHMCYEVANAREALEEIRAKGAPIDVELKLGLSRCIQFWTHDPDGNQIEFMELPPDCLQVQANARIAAQQAEA